MREEQVEELEVLQSIYEGDENFNVIKDNKFQYKYGESGQNKSFLVELEWGVEYPDAPPTINLDLFYNKHLLQSVKSTIIKSLQEQAEANLGMSMTFTLFEWIKESQEELLINQIPIENAVESDNEVADKVQDLLINDNEPAKRVKEKLTKSQKRRMWNRQNAAGEKPRGWDWVDIVKHLSQTGCGQATG